MRRMNAAAAIALAGAVVLGGCGTSPDEDWTQGLSRPESSRGEGSQGFGSGARAQGNNLNALDPMTDLPSDGTDGLVVVRPEGAKVTINLEYAPGIQGVAEGPNWASDPAAIERLNRMALFIESAVWTGYKQWARHLDGTYVVDVLVGEKADELCGHSNLACYVPDRDKVILGTGWLLENYNKLHRRGQYFGMPGVEVDVASELVWVATHEAAHQFSYRHPQGNTAGCGNSRDRCHAPRGSGSVVSYDTLEGGRSQYAPSPEDVAHIAGGRWNEEPTDVYLVAREGVPESVRGYGYWLVHDFHVEGVTDWGRSAGGSFDLVNNIRVYPFVEGEPSPSHGLTGSATWTGDFVGFNFNPTEMTALTADAEMVYSFAENAMGVAIDNFATWLGDTAYAQDWGPFTYFAPCSAARCAAEWDGYAVDVGFYQHERDPSGYAAGRLYDWLAGYAGAFGGEKD